MQVVVHLITPTDEEKMGPYWNVMFDDVEVGRDETPKDESKGTYDIKSMSVYMHEFEFVSKRQFKEFLVMMDEERRACMELAAELEHLRGNPVRKLFDKPLTSDKSARL
ncbi:hypothetical protein D8674_037712 [Pyrus ussuriensis x Pyrus communis]|uniref:Uncharacterized protein n=1 Tax=Pyrus ussuriensis x Pyrus communis TaxID=2448454 RepID=A0A5N5H3R2_9ROSA|nr:hypothetical protein D8674_037712 [Pyrus ussuriensis x Pyrus communis]